MSHDLDRFVDAQAPVWDAVRGELEKGEKRTHWMWFVFPQLDGLGRSPTAQHYAIRSLAEARAYLAHPVLGARLNEATALVLAQRDRRADAIFGDVDAMKLRSSLTLFDRAGGAPVFGDTLAAFFDGPDPATLDLLRAAEQEDDE